MARGKWNMRRWRTPCDPECPDYSHVVKVYRDDPMSLPVLDEMIADFERVHMGICERCREYGAANIDVAD